MTIRIFSSLIGLILMTVAFSADAVDLVVISSSAPGLKPGQIVNSGEPLQIPEGATVTLVSNSGKMINLKGPHRGPSGFISGATGDTRLIASLSGLLSGSGRDTASLGTMRAVGLPPPPTDPWVLDVGKSGDHCVPAKGPVTLWRAKSTRKKIFSLKNLSDRTKSQTDWAAGASILKWPQNVRLKDGGRYLARFKGSRAVRKFTLHLVPDHLPSDAHGAAWMAEKGCENQAKRLLSRLR